MKRLSVAFDRSGDDDARLVPDRGGRAGSIRALHACRDGTVLERCRFAAPEAAAVADALEGDDAVPDHAVLDDRTLYVHVRPGERVRSLLVLAEEHRLLLDTPVRFDAERVLVTLVGRAGHISAATDALPADVRADMHVERLAEYDEGADGGLTARQRDALAAAVEVGYYATPREATIADVAAALDVSTSTASEHLRKVEARVLPRFET